MVFTLVTLISSSAILSMRLALGLRSDTFLGGYKVPEGEFGRKILLLHKPCVHELPLLGRILEINLVTPRC